MASDTELALPGFAEFVRRDVDRAGAMDFTKKEYTATRIRTCYPETFKSVARALFFYKLPVTVCADLFRMNTQTVCGIRDQVIAESSTNPRALFLVNSRRHSQREIVLTRLIEAIADKLDDPETLAKLSVENLAYLLKQLESAPPARNGTDSTAKDKKDEIVILDATAFDDALNEIECDGFDAQKNGAPSLSCASDGENATGKCSTGIRK